MDQTLSSRQVLRDRGLRTFYSAFGLIICSFGTYLSLQAGLGVSPWPALTQGLAQRTGLSYGMIYNLISIAIVASDLLMREHIGVGTLLDIFVVGNFVDVFAAMNLVPAPESLPLQVALLFVSMVICAVGTIVYMKGALGCGPRDTQMVAIGKRLKRISIGTVSLMIFAVVFLGALLLGGPIGIGTILSVCCNGPIMDLVFRIVHFDPYAVCHESAWKTGNAVVNALRGVSKSEA